MFRRNMRFMFGLLLVLTLLMASCTAAETPVEEAPAESAAEEALAAEAETEEEAAEETPVLTLWVDSLFAESMQEISQDFSDKYGVEVVVQPMGMDEIREGMLISAPAGAGPDVIDGAVDWVGQLVEGGVLAPIDLAEKEDLYLPGAVQGFTYNGELYGLPMITENVGLFRNTDIADTAPATWDEMEASCEQLLGEGVEYCFLLQQGDSYHFFPIQTSFGGYIFGLNADGTYNTSDIGIDSEGSIAAAEWLDKMVKAGYIEAGVDFDTARALFAEGKAAYYLTGPWNIDYFKEAGVNYAISPIPAGTQEAKPFTGIRGLMVNSFSPQLLLAQTYITEFWATEDAAQAFFDATNKDSAFLSVRSNATDPDVAALGQAGLYAVPIPSIPEMGAFWSVMGDTITLVMQQQSSPEEAFRNAAEQMRTSIAGEQ